MKILENDPLGARSIDTVKLSDGKEWAMRMYENGFSYKTISNYKRSLKASFYMAIEDDCIRKNPFNFKLSDVLEDNSEPKVILTPEQEEKMLAFMEQDKTYSKYYDEVVILLETGLRISEFCGQHIMGHSNITMTLGYYQLMQSIFPKENADKALKYRLYRHLPAYEKIIRNLVSFYH